MERTLKALLDRLVQTGDPAEKLEEMGGGAFNSTFRVTLRSGRRCVLRVSPIHDHPMLLSNERHLLRREQSLGPFPKEVADLMPRTLAVDFTGEILPRDAVFSSFIEGENWDEVKGTMSQAQNDAVWGELGAALASIHRTKGEGFGWPAPEQCHKYWSDFILCAAKGLLTDCRRLGVSEGDVERWIEAVEGGRTLLDEIREARLLHGDPWPKNVLIRRKGDAVRLVGLIDHERGLWGDPMNEWVFHRLDFPPSFWEAYGPRPQGLAPEFRSLCYRGLIEIQILLEGVRCGRDMICVRQSLIQTLARMRVLLDQLGLARR